MMNFPSAYEDIMLAITSTPDLGLGVHLNLTTGVPMFPPQNIPTLCNKQGIFNNRDTFIRQIENFALDEVIAEWQAQIEAYISLTDRCPTHLDSHHHTSYFTPSLFRAMVEVAVDYDCAIRLPVANSEKGIMVIPDELVTYSKQQEFAEILAKYRPTTPDALFDQFFEIHATEHKLSNYLYSLPDGTYEVMCHPGYDDDSLREVSSYTAFREQELRVLKMPSIRENIMDERIQLISYLEILHESHR